MIQINLIRDRKVERVAGAKPAGAGVSFSLPKLPFNVGILASVLGVVIVLVVIVLTMISQKAQIASLESKIKGYNEELTKLAGPKRLVDDYLAKQADVNTKLNEIASIDKTRFYTVTLLDQLSHALPDYLWLTSMKDEKDVISMEGMTFSNLIVADFMDRLKGSGYFSNVELTQTTKATSEGRD
ncbi:MAG: PilN domain-containing protein, partial [Candidatus Edwardsbacteria bacterium]|nr:PilN domain-containing protein [Candidatus Edwardsbacteria bacterium]